MNTTMIERRLFRRKQWMIEKVNLLFQETQGMAKCEAFCCVSPVIVFNRTGSTEGVEHKVTGWASPDGDSTDFAKGILHWVENMRQGGVVLCANISKDV